MTKKQKEEAIIRMQQLTNKYNLNKNLVKYLKQDRIYYSYMVSGLFGCIDTIHYDKRNDEIIKNFENKHNAFVYHAIESNTQYGKILTLLYVSEEKNSDEWSDGRLDEQMNCILAHVYNLTQEIEECGDVFLSSDNGALIRTDFYKTKVIPFENLYSSLM